MPSASRWPRRWPLPGSSTRRTFPRSSRSCRCATRVFFPGGVLPLAVGRQKTIALIKDAVRDDQVIGVVTQRRAEEEDPGATDLYAMGTVARIVKLLKMGEDNYSLVVQGLARFRVLDLVQETPYLKARVERGRGQDRGRGRRARGAGHEPARTRARGHQADARAARGGHRAGRSHHRARPPRRSHRREPRRAGRGEAGGPRDGRPQGAHEACSSCSRASSRSSRSRTRSTPQVKGEMGEEPARVRPAPAAQGDQGRARRDGRARRTSSTSFDEQHREGQPAGRGREGRAASSSSACKTMQAGVGRVHGRAHLPRLDRRAAVVEVDRGQPRHRRARARSSTRTTTASRR